MMLREAARGKFTAIISLDGLIEAASHTRCLSVSCLQGIVCANNTKKYAQNTQIYRYYPES